MEPADDEDEERSPTPPPIWQAAGAAFDFMQQPAGFAPAVPDNVLEAVLNQLPQEIFPPSTFPATDVPMAPPLDAAQASAYLTEPLHAADAFPIDPSLVDLPQASTSAFTPADAATEFAPEASTSHYTHTSTTFISDEYGHSYVAEHSYYDTGYAQEELQFTEVFETGTFTVQAPDAIETPALPHAMLREESSMSHTGREASIPPEEASVDVAIDLTANSDSERGSPPPGQAGEAASEDEDELESDEDVELEGEQDELEGDEDEEMPEARVADEQDQEAGSESEEVEMIEERDDIRDTREPTPELLVFTGDGTYNPTFGY
jgi:hypothetical protein